MSILTIAFLGDMVGAPGRHVVQQQLPRLRAEHGVDLVIANAENARGGSGLSPELFRKVRALGIDAVTLGDHVYRDPKIASILEAPGEPIARPANLSDRAIGRPYIHLPPEGARTRSVVIITVLGRIFFPLPANDPFATVDRLLAELPDREAIVIVEAHMEATSEKAALARYLDGRVAAVIGSHTHVPTADARVLPRGTAFITDVGMCGPQESVIGRDIDATIRHMTTSFAVKLEVASGGEAMCGAVVQINAASRTAISIVGVQYAADPRAAPFA